jgi:hypothetical protein
MQRGEHLHAVEGKGKLEIDRLLSPQSAVIIEGSDALGFRNKVGRTLLRHTLDESQDGFLGPCIVPRR